MARVIFKNNNQRLFLQAIKDKSGYTNKQLAFLCRVHDRTLRDWLRGKYNISEQALLNLVNKFGLPYPKDIQIVDQYWYVAKGAKKGAARSLNYMVH